MVPGGEFSERERPMEAYKSMEAAMRSSLQSPQAVAITATVVNEVPSQHRVFIIEFGVVFNFNPQRTQNVGPYNYNIGSGQSNSLSSSPTDDCCDEIFFAIKVLQEGYPPGVTMTELRKAPPGRCLLSSTLRLVLNSAVDKNVLLEFNRSGDMTKLLKLEFAD